MKYEPGNLRHLFDPRSIAIIGASSNPRKLGHSTMQNILASGYKGEVHPVNPKGGEVCGLDAAKSILDLKGKVDVAAVVIPAKFTPQAVRECADAEVKFCIVMTSGFSEVGNAEVEREFVSYARKRGMRILGPNVFGIYTSRADLNFTFGPKNIRKGSMAIITQSGALGVAMLGKSAVENIGLSAIVSVGNKSDLSESDLVEYLMEDDLTRVIFIYIEGVKDGARLVRVLRKATTKKPVIMIKSGRSKRGAIAASSHTGSLAGADDVFDDIMRQCGVIRAESVAEAFDWAKTLAVSPVPGGPGSVIVTNGGGVGVMTADACEKYGVELLDDQVLLEEVFSPVMPDFGSYKNPVDITASGEKGDYDRALDAALETNGIDSVIALYCETAQISADDLKAMINRTHGRYVDGGKPVVYSLVGGATTEEAILALRESDAPVYADVYDAASAMGALYAHRRNCDKPLEHPTEVDIDEKLINEIVDKSIKVGRYGLPSVDAQKIMKAAGIAPPKHRLARSLSEAVEAAKNIGFPVVMKIVSKDILHKSDAGGIALDLQTEDEVVDAYQAIMQSSRRYRSQAVIDGVEVAEMVKSGLEVIIGARRDNAFGPIVMFGLGGIYVEVMKDVVFRAVPASRNEINRMIKEIRSYPLLLGVRGEKRKDVSSIVNVIERIGRVVECCDRITDIEINPLVVYEDGRGCKAIDARILLKREDDKR